MAGGDLYGRGRASKLPAGIWVLFGAIALSLSAVVAVPLVAALGAIPAPGHASAGIEATPSPTDDSSGLSPSASPTLSPSDEAPGVNADALALLAQIPDSPGKSIAQYYREQFGQAWFDQDRNGCDTRNDILRRDLSEVVLKDGTNGCKVLAGRLLDPYTGETVDFQSGASTSAEVQIDHIVPLAWAWRQGAEKWTFEDRMAFANDPANLLASIGRVNQAKSDSGPSEWLPPAESARCMYAEKFVAVVSEWRLGINRADRSALERILLACT